MGVHVYREWPGSFEIPGIGVPDPWAKRSSRKGGVNDGDPDLGQRSFGFSFLRYKFEIARLEGWEDFVRWERSGSGTEMDGGWLYPDEDDLMMWNEGNGSRERVAARIVDSRAAQHSKIQMREDKAFIDLLNELGMSWVPASGKTIGSGEQRIVDALAWQRDAAGKMVKPPLLTFAPGCVNHIFAMENYMGADGQKGACKEAVDCLRYLYQSGYAESAPPDGLNVLVLDPAPERNWFMGWYRCRGGGEMDFSRRDAKAQRFVDGEREKMERATFNAERSTLNRKPGTWNRKPSALQRIAAGRRAAGGPRRW